MEISTETLPEEKRVLVVDDVLATGGTAKAACDLLEKLEFQVVRCSFIITLSALKGQEVLKDHKVNSLLFY